jgi:hypothetical protein
VRLLSLSLAIILGGIAGAILAGGAAVWSLIGTAVLLLIPAAGIAALLADRAPPEVGLIAWSVLVILGAPLWIDRGAALSAAGMADLEDVLPSLHRGAMGGGAALPEVAEPPTSRQPLPPPPIEVDSDDLVVLPYEGTARSMLLAVSLESDRVVLETEMVFDTGATLTTISPKLLEELEIDIPDDAPTIQLQTANGIRSSPLLLLDRLWLGGFAVEGVSVSVCDNCGKLNGLIGLNVSSMFRVQVDQQARELTFYPEGSDRHLDIAHWLSLSLTRSRDGLSVTARNRSVRTVQGAVIEGSCGEPSTVTLPDILPGEDAQATFPAALRCERPDVRLLQAVW